MTNRPEARGCLGRRPLGDDAPGHGVDQRGRSQESAELLDTEKPLAAVAVDPEVDPAGDQNVSRADEANCIRLVSILNIIFYIYVCGYAGAG